MEDHVVLAGLGRIGYRVEQILETLEIPCVVIDLQGNRFLTAARTLGLVIHGDARLPEDLARTGVGRARAFLACSADDLSNLQFCLQARKLNPNVYTVARIQDRELAESLGPAFGINAVVDPVTVGVNAFVGAATDERALRRFCVEGRRFLGFRHLFEQSISAGTLASWRASEVFVLGVEIEDEVQRVGREQAIPAHCWAAVVGEESAITALLLSR